MAGDSPIAPNQKGTREVKVSHAPSALSASFDDPNWVARRIPQAWWRKVFVENGCDVYKIKKPALLKGELRQQERREAAVA